MKIKAETAKLSIEGNLVDLKNVEIEMSLEEIREMNIHNGEVSQTIPTSFDFKKRDKVTHYYSSTLEKIKIDDIVRILPSENCVSNSDIIKYDEKIDGKTCIVTDIEHGHGIGVRELKGTKKPAVISLSFRVESSWLEKLERNKTYTSNDK